MELKVYKWIVEIEARDPLITSPMVMESFQVKQNHASMILSNLCRYGLLSRYRDIVGNSYIYKLYYAK